MLLQYRIWASPDGMREVWRLEQAGVVRLLRESLQRAEEFIAGAGIPTAARRQAPFSYWGRGQEECRPGSRAAGMDSADDRRGPPGAVLAALRGGRD